MNTSKFVKTAVSTIILGAGLTACGPAGQTHIASASGNAPLAKGAAVAARNAQAAIKKADYAIAIDQAEIAVSGEPNRADYRAILAQAYMRAGRFHSAETTYSDVLALDATNGRAGLNLALMQISQGHNQDALETLDKYREQLSAADFGLAVALAGDTENAVKILEAAARTEGADAKTRQNLGLAFAMSGRWLHARIMASRDVPLDQLDARMTEWALFVRPATSADQVASLMGVVPVIDPGQPTRLALGAASNQALAIAIPEPEAETPVAVEKAATSEPAAKFEVAEAPVSGKSVTIALDDAKPVSEAPLIKAMPQPARQMVVPQASAERANFRPLESGRYVVQLGAYSSAARAEAAWGRALNRTGEVGNFMPATARVRVHGTALYRLSVSGFVTREAAAQVCTRVQRAGGSCFVRSISGDQPMQWARRAGGGTMLAARR
jgi:Flp pilus assembly protein TadD/cell division protein FtsN